MIPRQLLRMVKEVHNSYMMDNNGSEVGEG